MLFNSLHFLIFFPIVFILYWLVKGKHRWLLLLAASYYFYASWKIEYIGLLLFSTAVDYLLSLKMSGIESKKRRRPYLVLSLISNLGLLFFFKYYLFANESFQWILEQGGGNYRFHHFEDLLLPVGISFYTFRTLAYTIDVYNGKHKAEKHLGIFALYVSFFPQLVAGPIERFSNLGRQLKEQQQFSLENLKNGARLVLFGFFVKLVVADNLAPLVDGFYENPEAYSSLGAWIATAFYSLQIYGYFHGYSLIAIGLSLSMGFKIMDNFQNPYFATSIMEFWRRWHISLSTWFRDYLFIPLGGSRVNSLKLVVNISIVFIVSGLWHGANWTFVCWGALHGILYLAERFAGKGKVNSIALKVLMNFKTLIIVNLAWVFFRSVDFAHSGQVFQRLFAFESEGKWMEIGPSLYTILIVFALSEILVFNSRFDRWVDSKPFILRWSIYTALLFGILAFGGVQNLPFIYFQF